MYSCLWIPTPMWERLTRTRTLLWCQLLWCQFPFFHLLFKSCSTASHPHTYRRHKLNVFVGGSCSIRWCQCTSGGLCPRLTRSLKFIRCSQGSSSLCGRGANADCTWQEAELSRLEVWHVFFSESRCIRNASCPVCTCSTSKPFQGTLYSSPERAVLARQRPLGQAYTQLTVTQCTSGSLSTCDVARCWLARPWCFFFETSEAAGRF